MSWCCNRCVSNVSQPNVSINPVTPVLRRWSFSVKLAARLWIVSRVSMLFCVYGFQATIPYSTFSVTNIVRCFFNFTY